MRTFDRDIVKRATDQYAENFDSFDIDEWLSDKENIALTNENGDVALFECYCPGLMTGHYFFHSRGSKALKVAKGFLEEIFDLGVYAIRGLTPKDNPGAKWITRKLGFKFHTDLDTHLGPHELYIMTKDDWKDIVNHG